MNQLDLVKRAQSGDTAAFDALVKTYREKLTGVIFKYVRSSHDAEDLVQEALVRAYNALPGFRGDSAVYTWLYRIAINVAKNHVVAMNRKIPHCSDFFLDEKSADIRIGVLSTQITPENLLIQEELSAALKIWLEEMPAELSDSLKLREYEGLTYNQIADKMKCPIGTVRSRVFRARAFINKKLENFQENP